MLERTLRDLERELARWAPEEDVPARLAEVEAHLREGIEGRIELGLDAEAAEREAIAAFGDLRRFTWAYQGREVLGHLRWKWLIAMALALLAAAEWGHTPLYFAPQLLLVGALIGFAHTSFRTRRPAWLSVAIAFVVAAAVPVFYILGLSHEGMGNASRMVLVDGSRSLFPFATTSLDAAYEYRFLLAMVVGVPAGTDLLFASLGNGVRSRRRRVVV